MRPVNIFVFKLGTMINRVAFSMALLFSWQVCLSQINPREYTMGWCNSGKMDALPLLVTATRTAGNCFFEAEYKNCIVDSLLHDNAFCRHRPPGMFYAEICDSSEAHFFAKGITSANSGEYEYRVLLNARVPLVSWKPVPYFATAIPAPDKIGKLNWLGAYRAGSGDYLVVDLRKKGADSIISYTLVYWGPVQPVPEIQKSWYQTLAFKMTEGVLIAAFFGFIALLLINYRHKRKFRIEQQKKERLENDIRTLRAQLNPHFIFNALGSIQGLVNNGETDSASNYLSDFANLMRDVLDEKNGEYNVLEHEIQTLESYLKLEQLRFRFTYRITIDKSIQPPAVQVPALLLQPVVENAVKHGVAALQEKGQIDIEFIKNNNDMVARIADNGNGFDTCHTPYGYGLGLTKKRMAYAGKVSGTQAIFMEIFSGPGTSVTITYQNWLA